MKRKATAASPPASPPTSPPTTSPPTAPATVQHHPVRVARAAHGLTQETLAAAVGVTRQTVISIESGDYAPSVILAIRIARSVESTVEELWGAAADFEA
jgi:putative transcriptional regulator